MIKTIDEMTIDASSIEMTPGIIDRIESEIVSMKKPGAIVETEIVVDENLSRIFVANFINLDRILKYSIPLVVIGDIIAELTMTTFRSHSSSCS